MEAACDACLLEGRVESGNYFGMGYNWIGLGLGFVIGNQTRPRLGRFKNK